MREVLLSKSGGDRATAYTMSNKIVSLPEGYLCTWIDCRRQNRWALVDRDTGNVLRSGPLGGPRGDNHCGAALALARDAVHAVTGGHHSPLEHHVLTSVETGDWRPAATIDAKATYPGIACDSGGRLHLAFRSPGERWSLHYCRFLDGRWMAPRPLVMAHKSGYIYWTNGVAVGPDDSLHIVFGNTRVLDDGALHYGASHLFSMDGGETWASSDGSAVHSLPVPAEALPVLGDGLSPDRIQSLEQQRLHEERGPGSFNYQQLLLSNPVVDGAGDVHVVLHKGLVGEAALMSRRANRWTARPLTNVVTAGPGKRIHMQSSLSLDPMGRFHAAVMVEPGDRCVWGPPGTHIVRVAVGTDAADMVVEWVSPSDRESAHWLPALEHPVCGPLDHVPPLLYTHGRNAGGFANNKNELATEVRLLCP